MSRNSISLRYSLDWVTIIIFFVLIIFGWMNVYGASYNFDQSNIFDFSQRAGKQFVWILTALGIAGAIILIDYKIYSVFAYIIYAGVLILLILTIFVATNIKGSHSWLVIGPVSFQPAELAKTATALALAKFISSYNFKLKHWRDYIPVLAIIFTPSILIVLQNETGGALVFLAFLLVLYREGMSGTILLLGTLAIVLFIVVIRFSIIPIQVNHGALGMVLGMIIIYIVQFVYTFFTIKHKKESLWLLLGILGIGVTSYLLNFFVYIDYSKIAIVTIVLSGFYWGIIEIIKRYKKYWTIILITFGSVSLCISADYLFNKILEPHQQVRIKVLLSMEEDPRGAGYNVNQSKIAIGSGGLFGKGYLNGTQTKLKYVPEQDTDFIFCTVGEEWGFLGSTITIILYWWLLLRILKIAERQREKFNQVYGYGVASILFFHLMINIGMVIGIMPVIGIPLPFLSYGGSSLWSFTILLFILLRLDASRLDRGIKTS